MVPQLPTDNLYKFLALGGLFLFCFCFWIPIRLQSSIQPELEKARKELLEAVADDEEALNHMTSTIRPKAEIKLRLALPNVDGKPVILAPGQNISLLYSADKRGMYRQCISEFDGALLSCIASYDQKITSEPEAKLAAEAARKARDKLRQHSFTIENVWRLADEQEYYERLATVGRYAGIGFAVLGFVLWYSFVQRHQDSLARSQALKEKQGLQGRQDTRSAQPTDKVNAGKAKSHRR